MPAASSPRPSSRGQAAQTARVEGLADVKRERQPAFLDAVPQALHFPGVVEDAGGERGQHDPLQPECSDLLDLVARRVGIPIVEEPDAVVALGVRGAKLGQLLVVGVKARLDELPVP